MPRPLPLLRLIAVVACAALAGCSSTPDPAAQARATSDVRSSAAADRSLTERSRSGPVSRVVRTERAQPTPLKRERDAYVLLSGGGTPLTNNYSQYLQARAMAGFFERECPPERTWVFFGAGNQAGATPVLADVRRELKQDGMLVESWLPGVLPRNRPATRESFLRALREEILPLVREGGTLYLFVGDHGELAGRDKEQESAITMWQLKQSRRRPGNWSTDEQEILGVGELRKVLAAGLGAGRVVFGMTQCHGGGFHELGVAPEMSPPPAWFAGPPPAWAAGTGAGVRWRMAGYTATDEASLAAGCDADPDPERWAGYERFLPEGLLGIDLMSGEPKSAEAVSLADAHERATLVDQTIDKPRSTSEHYLEAWARLIETQLAGTLLVTPEVRNAIEAFKRAVDRGEVAAGDATLRARAAQFQRFTERLGEQAPAAKGVLLTGTRSQLEQAIRGRGTRGGSGRGGRRSSAADARRAWTETVRPAWKAAVLDGRVDELIGDASGFEKRLLKLEDGGREFLLPRGASRNALRNEMYWESGYSKPTTMERARAEAVTRWGADRRSRIVEWAKGSSDSRIREAAEKIGPGPVFVTEPPEPLSEKTAAERVLFYRRVLAAWEFLITLRAEPALAELQLLIELEQLPVRPAS